jgi:hypothetical protein
MKIRIIGAGFYGCHIGLTLLREGHDVHIFEIKDSIFKGASGCIPARIHKGFHYPRSKKTRDACQAHAREFEEFYSTHIREIPTNIYAIAANRSMVDFEQYVHTLRPEVPFEVIKDPSKYGLRNIEGAILTEEKHIVTDDVKEFYQNELDGCITFGHKPSSIDDPAYDVTIDATFCAYDSQSIDRYEPCVVGILEGSVDVAVTVMDGPFGSVYPWNPSRHLVSLSSARFTPYSKMCKTWDEANLLLQQLTDADKERRVQAMYDDLSGFYPALKNYNIVRVLHSIRAMPLSGADTRLIDIIRVGETGIRIRAGKIDAVVEAAQRIKEML